MRLRARPIAAWVVAGLLLGVACRATFTDDVRYACATDADCGGDGYTCIPLPSGTGACCRKTGDEVCGDGQDNDCDGLVDGADSWPTETCNGLDDDCDQDVDEGFDLLLDNANCGSCGHACGSNQLCVAGACVTQAEGNCLDGIDNDMNGDTDCADITCNLAVCGPGCQCQARVKAEQNCTDGVDNDGDSLTDCADSNCAGAGCGDGGCVCQGGAKAETACDDAADNDDDAQADCADSDCAGRPCQPGTTRTCSAMSCLCNGGAPVEETSTGALCRDRLDNDCDGLVDCQEPNCDGAACTPDGGVGCQCAGGRAKETACADRFDNDGDGDTDCADSTDCPQGTPCTFLNAGGQVKTGACNANKICQ